MPAYGISPVFRRARSQGVLVACKRGDWILMLQRSRVRARVSARAIAKMIDPPRIEPELSIGKAVKAVRPE